MDASREHLPAKVLHGVGCLELWGAPVGDVQSKEVAIWQFQQHGCSNEGENNALKFNDENNYRLVGLLAISP